MEPLPRLTGRTYFHEAQNGELAFAGFLIKYTLDNTKVNPKYLKFFTLTNEYKTWVKNLSVGSTRGNINAQTFANCPITVPDRTQQDFLVTTLSLLTDKRSLNNQINAELEAMAKTLYDYWFVQFDFPNVEGKPYKASGGKMLWNRDLKREIPEGWGAGTLLSLGEIIGGSTPSKEIAEYFSTNGTPWITPKDLSMNGDNKFITRGEIDVSDKGIKAGSLKIMPEGTILLSSRAPIGYMAISREIVTSNQGFKSFVPRDPYSTPFIFYTVKNALPEIISNASGSTFKEISGGTLKTIKVCLPEKSIIENYTKKVAAIFERQNLLELENQKLSELRDWLLPMLMNGQVRVKSEKLNAVALQ